VGVTLHCGDCAAVMAGMPAESVDLILTSPPYDSLRKYDSGHAFDFPALADQCKRVLVPGGVLVWVVGDQSIGGDETGTAFRQALHFKCIGLRLNDTMIFRKANPFPDNQPHRYRGAFEFMFVFAKGRPRVFNCLTEPCKQSGRVRTAESSDPKRRPGRTQPRRPGVTKDRKPRPNVWAYLMGKRTHGHPATFPLQLAVDHILSWTNPGDTVLDPFVGSGTTLEACLKTDRNGIGIDVSAAYLAIASDRIAAARAATSLFPAAMG
jgi:DNA modification methylase